MECFSPRLLLRTVLDVMHSPLVPRLCHTQRGFTILELLVVIAILGVTLTVMRSGMGRIGPKYEIANAARTAVSGISQARTHAITRGLTTHIDFGQVSGAYTIVETDASTQIAVQEMLSNVSAESKVFTFSSIGTLATGSDTSMILSKGTESRTITVQVTGEVSLS